MSDIKSYVLSLSPSERIRLISFIAASLEGAVEKEGLEVPEHIIEESREVFKQWDSGKLTGISWKELRQELKQNYLDA